MTIWTENGKQTVLKHYLTMLLREAYALYLDSCINVDEKCSFSTFCNLWPKNVLLMETLLCTYVNAKFMKIFFFLIMKLWA